MRKKNGIVKVVKLLISVILTGLVVVAGITVAKKTRDDSKQSEPKNTINENINLDNNKDSNSLENTESDKKESVEEKLTHTSWYYWQNPSAEYEEYIVMGMQGSSIHFEDDGTFSVDGGNGNWHEGSYKINGNTIICTIEKHNSEWHNEAEVLETTTEIKFIYNQQKNSLEVTNITKPTLTIHVIDLVTGELTEETKEYSLEQFTVGNIYSSQNKYEEIY